MRPDIWVGSLLWASHWFKKYTTLPMDLIRYTQWGPGGGSGTHCKQAIQGPIADLPIQVQISWKHGSATSSPFISLDSQCMSGLANVDKLQLPSQQQLQQVTALLRAVKCCTVIGWPFRAKL
jgi:hypothetical protein